MANTGYIRDIVITSLANRPRVLVWNRISYAKGSYDTVPSDVLFYFPRAHCGTIRSLLWLGTRRRKKEVLRRRLGGKDRRNVQQGHLAA